MAENSQALLVQREQAVAGFPIEAQYAERVCALVGGANAALGEAPESGARDEQAFDVGLVIYPVDPRVRTQGPLFIFFSFQEGGHSYL